MSVPIRADVALVEKKLASSRNRAQELIDEGVVFIRIDGLAAKKVTKSSLKLSAAEIEALVVELDPNVSRFVSRGGFKLQGALERTGLSVQNQVALDVGISTGGFSDCLLQRGAKAIVGLDVGHGQLDPSLAKEERIQLLEGVNARDLTAHDILSRNAGQKFDLIVTDVSFISLTLVLPEVIRYLLESGSLLALVKPQFEVGREGLGKNGIVKDAKLYLEVEKKIRDVCERCGLRVEDYFESSIEGSDGNREFFVYAKYANSTSS